jgi:hypothetical protein
MVIKEIKPNNHFTIVIHATGRIILFSGFSQGQGQERLLHLVAIGYANIGR